MAGAWIDINLNSVAENYQEVIKRLQSGSRCMAVVKADGYGLGSVEMATALQDAGCEAFAVTTVEEGLILRQHGIQGLILVLGPSSPEEWPAALKAGLNLALSQVGWVRELETIGAEMNCEAQVHIKLETGMGRTGFLNEDLDELALELRQAQYVKAVGVFTHLARAAQKDQKYTHKQHEQFQEMISYLDKLGVQPLWKHICNSAAFLDYPEWHYDFVRIGTLLIGHNPGTGFAGQLKLKDPWTAKSKIVHIKTVPKGTYVGYQSIYRTKKQTQLAVIPLGYADGFGVEPHLIPQGWIDLLKIIIKNTAALFGVYLGQERVLLHGRTVGVAGKIGMQLTVLDVGLIPCALGDEVIVPMRRTLANPRILRRYWKDGRILKERVMQEGFLQSDPE